MVIPAWPRFILVVARFYIYFSKHWAVISIQTAIKTCAPQDISGRRADESQEEADSETRYVPEDDWSRWRCPHTGGTWAESSYQTTLHAVERDHQLHSHTGLSNRRHQGEMNQNSSSKPISVVEFSWASGRRPTSINFHHTTNTHYIKYTTVGYTQHNSCRCTQHIRHD